MPRSRGRRSNTGGAKVYTARSWAEIDVKGGTMGVHLKAPCAQKVSAVTNSCTQARPCTGCHGSRNIEKFHKRFYSCNKCEFITDKWISHFDLLGDPRETWLSKRARGSWRRGRRIPRMWHPGIPKRRCFRERKCTIPHAEG